jgi:hypothetical protein
MIQSNTQLVGSKTDTRKQFLILSRIKDKQTRDDLEIAGDEGGKGCVFFDENQAQQEYAWLTSHNNIREYILVARVAKVAHTDLDDDIPF